MGHQKAAGSDTGAVDKVSKGDSARHFLTVIPKSGGKEDGQSTMLAAGTGLVSSLTRSYEGPSPKSG